MRFLLIISLTLTLLQISADQTRTVIQQSWSISELFSSDSSVWSSPRRKPGSSFRQILDSGLRQNDGTKKFTTLDAKSNATEDPDVKWRTDNQIAQILSNHAAGGLRFAVLGDSRPERHKILRKLFYPKNAQFEKFLKIQSGLNLDFTIHLGDFVITGAKAQYEGFLKFLDDNVSWPLLTVIGNHEVKEPEGEATYQEKFGDEDYYFDFKGFRFIALGISNEERGISPAQLSWLQGILATNLRKIVLTHIPPKELASWSKSKVGRGLAKTFGGGFEGHSEDFVRLMEQNKVERVYVGHLHGFGVAQLGSVRYVLSGGAGSPLYPWRVVAFKIFNFVLVEIGENNQLKETVYLGDGTSRPIESFPVYTKLNPNAPEQHEDDLE